MKQFFTLAASLFLLAGGAAYPSFAQKAGASSAEGGALTVSKTLVRPVPGARPNETATEVTFEIVWHSKTPPEAIFYRRGATQWLDCKATKPEKRPFGGGPNDFMLIYMGVPFSGIKAGDHLTLTTGRHGHDPMPPEVKKMSGDALYYQLAGSSKWYLKKVGVPKLPAAK